MPLFLLPSCWQCITYSRLPITKDQDGLVALHVGASTETNLQAQWSSIRSTLLQLAAPLVVEVVLDGVRSLPDSCSEMTIYLLRKSDLGGTDRIPALTVYDFLKDNVVRNMLCRMVLV